MRPIAYAPQKDAISTFAFDTYLHVHSGITSINHDLYLYPATQKQQQEYELAKSFYVSRAVLILQITFPVEMSPVTDKS